MTNPTNGFDDKVDEFSSHVITNEYKTLNLRLFDLRHWMVTSWFH